MGGNESSGNSIGGGLAASMAPQPSPWQTAIGSGLQSFGQGISSGGGALPQFGSTAFQPPQTQQTDQLGGLIPEPQPDLIAILQRLLAPGRGDSGYGVGTQAY